MSLRMEATYTDPATSRSNGGKFIYWDVFFYHNQYVNKNNIMGSWVGREGKGYQAWSTYSFRPRTSLQFGFRHVKVDPDFIPAGETVNDGSVKFDVTVHRDVSVSATVQYERWLAPLLAPTAQTNWTSSFQVVFWPQSWKK